MTSPNTKSRQPQNSAQAADFYISAENTAWSTVGRPTVRALYINWADRFGDWNKNAAAKAAAMIARDPLAGTKITDPSIFCSSFVPKCFF